MMLRTSNFRRRRALSRSRRLNGDSAPGAWSESVRGHLSCIEPCVARSEKPDQPTSVISRAGLRADRFVTKDAAKGGTSQNASNLDGARAMHHRSRWGAFRAVGPPYDP